MQKNYGQEFSKKRVRRLYAELMAQNANTKIYTFYNKNCEG